MSSGFSNMLKFISCGTRPIRRIAPSRSRVEVDAEHLDLAGSLVDQRTDDADQGGLAGAVRAEQGEEIAGRDVQLTPFSASTPLS
jgi:hypothetical protein